jgi:hypothetical protein
VRVSSLKTLTITSARRREGIRLAGGKRYEGTHFHVNPCRFCPVCPLLNERPLGSERSGLVCSVRELLFGKYVLFIIVSLLEVPF